MLVRYNANFFLNLFLQLYSTVYQLRTGACRGLATDYGDRLVVLGCRDDAWGGLCGALCLQFVAILTGATHSLPDSLTYTITMRGGLLILSQRPVGETRLPVGPC